MIKHYDFKWDEFIEYARKLKTNKLNGEKWIDCSSSFDIETTNAEPVAFMYLWGFSFFNKFNVYGRTWSEFLEFLSKLEQVLKENKLNLIIYIHNINFEYAFMYEFIKDKLRSTFAKGEHDLLYFRTPFIWWRCSAKLTRLNLEKSCIMYNTNHKKAVGDLDYSKLRFPTTELTEKELHYFEYDLLCVNDVVEAVKINKNSKSILAMPMTLTGFTRKKAKNNCDNIEYHNAYKSLKINNEIYGLAEDGQKGGACECSIWKKNKIISNVDMYDFNSQHIYIMLCEYFPMSAFRKFQGNENDIKVVKEVLETKCCLFDIYIDEIELKKDKDFGIIGTSHIQNKGEAKIEIQYDFRVIKAKNIRLTLNEIDLEQIFRFYDVGKFQIFNLWVARRMRLPYQIRDVIWELLQNKVEFSKYKGTEKDFMYQNKKQELNSFSGMLQTKTIHPTWDLQNNGQFRQREMSNSDKYNYLAEYHKSFAHFTYYPWGNWIISHSRKMLFDLIDCAKPHSHIYHDTDSCYALGFDILKLNELNKKIESTAEYYGYNIGRLGQADLEHKNIDFKMLGIKQYAIKENGEVKITIAGIPKENGKYLNGDLNNFKLGCCFPGALKTATYVSAKKYTIIDDKGKPFETAGYCKITNEDFILKNYDSKIDLLEGYIYDGL